MKKIQFRVWDEALKGFHYHLFRSDDYLAVGLNQYTGLKDKNGREIYEGDILRNIDWGQPERWWGVVIWQIAGWVVSYHKPTNKTWTELTAMANGNCDYWEIIGNIYQSKEILEGLNG